MNSGVAIQVTPASLGGPKGRRRVPPNAPPGSHQLFRRLDHSCLRHCGVARFVLCEPGSRFRLGSIGNLDIVPNRQGAASLRQSCSDAFVLDDVGLALNSRHAIFNGHGEVFRIDFRFCKLRPYGALDLSVPSFLGIKLRWAGHRFDHRCCLTQPRENDGQSQRGDKFSHAVQIYINEPTATSGQPLLHPFREGLYAVDFAQPFGAFEDFPRLAAVGRPDDAVTVHHVEDTRRPAVSKAQPALQSGS
jgi:hypothetical protein